MFDELLLAGDIFSFFLMLLNEIPSTNNLGTIQILSLLPTLVYCGSSANKIGRNYLVATTREQFKLQDLPICLSTAPSKPWPALGYNE